MFEKPNDVRNFVHKRIIGAVGGLLGGGPLGAVGGFISGGGRGSVAPRGFLGTGFVQSGVQCVTDRVGRSVRKGTRGQIACDGTPVGIAGLTPGINTPAERSIGITGEAVMGRYGAAMAPQVEITNTLLCLPGMVLGKDDLCYNKGKNGISNSQRKWPKGTKPLGTPGEMAALSKAASFGRRMETTVKRMQKIGVLKKPTKGRARTPAPRARQIAGPSIINVE